MVERAVLHAVIVVCLTSSVWDGRLEEIADVNVLQLLALQLPHVDVARWLLEAFPDVFGAAEFWIELLLFDLPHDCFHHCQPCLDLGWTSAQCFRLGSGIWKLGRCKEEKGKRNRQLGKRKRQTEKQANGSGTRKCGRRKFVKQESVQKAKEVGVMQLTGNWRKKGRRGESLFCSGGCFDWLDLTCRFLCFFGGAREARPVGSLLGPIHSLLQSKSRCSLCGSLHGSR